MTKIGYFIPEFPGQTHIFFWRERRALLERGVQLELVSTRRPPRNIISHEWAKEAMELTEYLATPKPATLASAVAQLARSMPAGWARCVRSMARAEGLGPKGRVRLLGLALVGAHLADLARSRGWTHVHVHSCADAAHVALFAHLLSGLPYSLTLHGPLRDYGPNQREKWRHAQFAVVITQKLLREVTVQLAGSLPAVVDVAPMGVDLASFVRKTPYAPWSGEGPLKIFSCGRLNFCKGHEDLIRAVGILRERGLDARLSIAGEDEAGGTGHRKVLEAQINKSRLDDPVALLGAVSEKRVHTELDAAHIFALASLAEPLGVAIMEAMANETPIVVTNAGGVPELVEDGVDGLTVPPQRPHELARRIEELARDPRLALRLTETARRKVERHFSSGRSADLLAKRLRAL